MFLCKITARSSDLPANFPDTEMTFSFGFQSSSFSTMKSFSGGRPREVVETFASFLKDKAV